MLPIEDTQQKGLIITDDIAISPILDFNSYRDAVINIVKNSYPKFTVGIFGDWGTGKTTLMDSIDKAFKDDKNIVRVQFETWRYEREDQFALIPLLKTIAFALPDEPNFLNLKQKVKRGIANLFKKTPDILSSILSKYLGDGTGKITQDMFDSFKIEFNSKVELLAEVDRDTLYFDGFEDIRKEMKQIMHDNPYFRIVVFVDDLDRCSPKKTLEVLESIKVFLGMEGFIYIIGISHDVVTKLIDIEFEKIGVKGEQYIKKMIQIPITLPKWDHEDISRLVTDFINREIIHENYREVIKENIDLLSSAVENNPREIKRFLNNFIVAYEIFSKSKDIKPKELLVIQAIQLRWNSFYHQLVGLGTILTDELAKYLKLSIEDRIKKLESKDKDEKFDYKIKLILRSYISSPDLWEFINNHSNILLNIKDFAPYRRAAESTKDIAKAFITDKLERWEELSQRLYLIVLNEASLEESIFAEEVKDRQVFDDLKDVMLILRNWLELLSSTEALPEKERQIKRFGIIEEEGMVRTKISKLESASDKVRDENKSEKGQEYYYKLHDIIYSLDSLLEQIIISYKDRR